jgi:Protein of unknown function (DUF3592)
MGLTPTARGTRRFPLWISALLLAGSFIGLCTLFSLVVTIAVAWQEHRHAHWPETAASIRQCSVESRGEQSAYYVIDCQIDYTVNHQLVTSHVLSQSLSAPEKIIWELHPGRTQRMFGEMQEWVQAHPPGTLIEVHYDPSNDGKAALVTTDMPLGGPQTEKNVKFTAALAAVCVALLAVGAIARRFAVQ